MMTSEYYEHEVQELREKLQDAEQQLDVLRPGGRYAWKSKHEAVVASISHMHDIRDGSPNAFYAAFDRLWTLLQAPGAVTGEDCAVDPVGHIGTEGTTRDKEHS